MSITTAPELYTALTDLLAVPFTAFFTAKCISLYKNTKRGESAVWGALFAVMGISSLIGFVAHFFVFPQSVKDALWVPLSFLLCATATLVLTEAATEFFGEKYIKKAVGATSVLLLLGFVLMMIGKAAGVKYILIFVFYAIAVVVTALALYTLIFIKRKEKHIIFYFIGCALQALGAVFQVSRSLVIDIGIVIDYNSIYHILNIISLIPFYIGVKKCVLQK